MTDDKYKGSKGTKKKKSIKNILRGKDQKIDTVKRQDKK